MGIFGISFSRSKSGDPQLLKDFGTAQNTAYSGYEYGGGLTSEGLGGLRSLDQTYQAQLANPLGPAGSAVFARARGALSDDAVRAQRSSQARIFQLAKQSGGYLSPEAQAELQSRNERGINEDRFSAESDLGIKEGAMTLDATSKLFDRMEGIRKTILGVGQDERTRALESIVAMLSARVHRTGSYSASVSGG